MFRLLSVTNSWPLAGIFVIGVMALTSTSEARSFKVLHSFSAGADGCYPAAGLTFDGAGNLYGTTTGSGGCNCGTVFKIPAGGSEAPLYDFTCGSNGEGPDDTLAVDEDGNLYGATYAGGNIGCGVIFKVKPDGAESTVHDFSGPPGDGCIAQGTLVLGLRGNLYGTTSGGGANREGAIFKLFANGTIKMLRSFKRRAKGYFPAAGVIMDGSGNLYGTTVDGGRKVSAGVVFELPAGRGEEVLYAFKGSPNDGSAPQGGLIIDQAENLYGTLRSGGLPGCESNTGCGAVFKLAPDGKESVIHFFSGTDGDGANPVAGLIADSMGNIYGTTQSGGRDSGGTVFEISVEGTETILHRFMQATDGANPAGGLVADAAGDLYGTANFGGQYGYGTVFEITP
jgi:uncharacterized repeat protein (TIGR03803 family)